MPTDPIRRPSLVPLLLAAVLALTAAAVAERVEEHLVAPSTDATATVADISYPGTTSDTATAPVAAPLASQAPLTSAALPAGEMVLTFADGSASISTGANEPIFELGTTTIGDVDLSVVEPVLAQADTEVSADWGAVSEWYRAAGDGIEHGYTVDEPVSTGDDLTMTLDVVAGEPTLVDEQTVAIERTDGSTVWYRGLFAFDAIGIDLPAEMAVVDGDIELRIDTAGADYPITIDPTISEVQKLVVLPDAAGDRFGESVAIDGVPGDMTVVVGAVGDDDRGVNQGAAYVFHNDGSGWTKQAKLFPSTLGNRQFGWDVDVRGEVIVVGAPGDDENGEDAGAVYVFEPTGPSAQWQQTSVVYQCDPSISGPCGETPVGTGFDGAGFGFAVDLTDQFLLVGAPRFQSAEGGAWVYLRSGAVWQTSAAGVIARDDAPAAGDQFGYAVAGADAGTHVVVGAPGVDAFAVDAGRTYYFRWDGSTLSAPLGLTSGNTLDGNTGASVEVELDAQDDVWLFSGAPVNTRFEDGTQPGVSYAWRHVLPAGLDPVTDNLLDYGSSAGAPAHVAFTGAHVLFADYLADGTAVDAGSAVAFPVDPDPAFNLLGTGLGVSLPANAGDNWGFDVAATGDTYVIGGPGNDAAGIDAGEVRIGSFSSPSSVEVISPDVDGESGRLGAAVDVEGNRMVASAPFADVGAVGGAGAISVYERSDEASPWGLVATIPSPLPEVDGGFGDSVALFGDVLAVGESDRLGGSDEPGRVFVFRRDVGGNWVQLGGPIVSGQVDFDGFGASLDFLFEEVLVIGSPGFDGEVGDSAGAVFRADWNGTTWSAPVTIAEGGAAGDEFGYSVAMDLWLAVGAPGVDGYAPPGPPAVGPQGGALRVFEFTGNGPSGFEFRRGFSGYLTGSRVGTAVDVFGNRIVVGGYGNGGTNTTLRFDVVEFVDPDGDGLGDWVADVVRSFETGFDLGEQQVNDYLDIEGGVVAIGAPGAGGQVGLFQFDGFTWSSSPVDVVQPAGRQLGDRIGRAIALDGRTLVIGAPGDDGAGDLTTDAGAVYSVQVPVVATTVEFWYEFEEPADYWDVGVVPGPDDHAIVSEGVSNDVPFTVSDPTTFGRLTVFDALFVTDQLQVVGPTRIDGGLLAVEDGGEFRPLGDIDVDNFGELSIAGPDLGSPGLLAIDGDVSVAGTGQISNFGDVVKTSAGTLGVGPAVTWYSEPSSSLDILQGSVLFAGGPIETVDGVDGFPGFLRVAAGTTFDVWSNLVLTESSRIETEIVGPSSDVANYGRVQIDVELTKDGLLSSDLVGYSPGPADAYPVITCLDCYPGRFDELATTPFDVATTESAITLQLVDGKLLGPNDAIERFGFDVDIDGDWAVVGAPEPNGDTYVYELVDGEWVLRQELGNPASSVTIDGNAIAGGGYLYTRSDPETSFTTTTVIGGDVFDIDGDLLIVGSSSPQGVTVQSVSGGVLAELEPPTGPVIPSFGASVAIVDLGGGNAYAAVGAPEELGGRVYTYKRSAGTWNLIPDETLTSPDGGAVPDAPATAPRGQFGNSIAIDGTTIDGPTMVIGERLNSADSGEGDAGAAWVYEGVPGGFLAPVELQASDGDAGNVFGSDVAVDGDVIIVGAGAGSLSGVPFRDGTAYVFDRSGSTWTEREALRAPDGANGERFGDAVAISGDNVLVGAPEDTNSNGPRAGAIYAFTAVPAPPTATTFTNAGSDNSWTTDANWSTGAVPGPADDVVIPAGSSVVVGVADDVIVDELTVEGEVRVEGTLTMNGVSSLADGTIQIAAGANVSVAAALALNASSVIEIGIDGPSTDVANYGRLDLTGDFTIAGTLRAAIDVAYTPTAADRYPAITCGFCSGAFDLTETAPLDVVIRATSIALDAPAAPEPDDPTFALFDFGASTTEVSVASTGIATSAIPSRNVSGGTGQAGSVASTSLVGIDLNRPVGSNVAASPIASLTIGESVLAAIDGASSLDNLPLTDIDVTVPIPGTNPPEVGGWEEVLRQIGDPVLLARPPQNIRFGEIKGQAIVKALRLDQLTLAGTPIASLPIASLVLGSTPIASLGAGIDWCDEINSVTGSTDCNGIDPINTTLVELTLAGIPIASLPIASLPIASLPIASLPIASLPIASLDLASTPIASLPIASLGPAGTPIASLPIASLPIASLPVSGIPIASLPIASLPIASLPIASLPIASLPIASLPVAGTPIASLSPDGSLVSIPIASLDVTGTPIASLPIASLPIASLPIASLPIASLPIASLPIASLPIASLDVRGTPIASLTVDGTLATLPIASLPIASLPIASLPIASLPIASLPIASLPIASLPIASLPIASLPIASLDVTGTPIASLSTDGTLASVPIASLPIASLPIASLPIASLPIASLEAVVDCTAIDCTSADISLAEALDRAPRVGVNFETFAPLIAGLRWSELLPVLGLTEAEFAGILVDLKNSAGGTFTIGDALDFGDLTVGELPQEVLEQLFLGDLAPFLDGLRLGDLVDIIGPDGELLDPTAVEAALTAAKDQLSATLEQVLDLDDLTLGDLVDDKGDSLLGELSLGDVAPFLTGLRFDDLLGVFPGLSESQVRDAFDQILANSSLTLGELLVGDATFDDLFGSDEFGELTLQALIEAILDENPNALDGITLGDLLLAFVGPSDYPWDAIVFDEIDPTDIPGLVGAVTFDADFELTGSTRGQSVDIAITLPATASYLPGTAVFGGASLAEPTIVGNVLTWRLSGLAPGTPYTLSLDLQPTLQLGSSTVGVEARIVGVADAGVVATSSVSVQQAFEPNNDPATAKQLDEDTIYVNHVASADDLDFFRIDVTDGQRLVVNLSNLDADFDVVVYGRSESASIVPLVPSSGQSAGAPTPDPVIEPDGTTQVQTELTGAATTFDGLPIVATGNRRGTATETVVTPPLEAGTVYVKVFGANGESSVRAAVLQAEITEATSVPECLPLTSKFAGGVAGTQGTIPTDANTLILVNQERLSALYPAGSGDPYTEVFARLDALVGFLNSPGGADVGIVPGVLDVGQIAGIADDYATWDAEPCNSAKANAVVAEITAEITRLRQTRNIEHILVVGGDDIVPHARVTDGAEISNEFDYRFTFSGNNAIAGSAWDRQILTDEPYGETAALNYGNRFLYVTDTALGRLVDTPSEIAFQLKQFVTAQGRLDPTTGLVVGYDFLDDGSEAIAADLRAALGPGNVDDEFGSSTDTDDWTAGDLADKLFPIAGTTPDVISLNAHFDHRRALPALGNSIGDESELFEATAVFNAAPGSLTGRVTFSMGCHSGLAVSDATIGVLSDDFAQAFTRQGGVYVGNTGFGYGDTETVAYSERLMELFGEELLNPILLDRPTTAGQALQFAKNTFFSELGNVSVYDEKALMESTFYGVPFYRVALEPEAPEPTPTTTTQIDPITGDPVATFTVTPDNEVLGTTDGTKYVNQSESGDPLELKSPFNPAQPLELVDVSVVDPAYPTNLDLVARGAIVTRLNSTYVTGVDPIIVRPVADDSATQPEPDVGDVVFPVRPTAIRTTSQAEGERQTLALATGQFRGSSTNGVQRLDNELGVVVYYAEQSETDFTAPLIGAVDSFVVDGQLSIAVDVSDADGVGGSGIDRVYVLVAENPGVGTVEWRGVELARDQATIRRWVGSLSLSPGTEDVQLFVQAKDGAGNVGFSSNKGENFGAIDVEEPPPPPADVEVTIDGNSSADVPATVLFDAPVTVVVNAGLLPVEYRLRNGPITPFPTGGLVIDAEGASRLQISVGGEDVVDRVIRIDRTLPTVQIASPIDGSTPVVGELLVASFTCSDASLVSCEGTLDGTPILVNADLSDLDPGGYTLEVTATDAAGNQATTTSTFTVVGVQAAPEITVVDGLRTPQLITDGFTVDIEFTDLNFDDDDYTVTIDWGDGDEDISGSSTTCVAPSALGATAGNPACEILASPSPDGPGLAVGTFEYSDPGVYAITVTVDDGTDSTVSVFQFATIYDPGAGRVSGAGLYWSGPEAYDGGRWGSTAIFGYNARYKGDDAVPRGQTKLRLLGEFFFKSTSYDYLIINDTLAVAEGTGRFNGRSGYDFRVQGIDNGWLDFFQLTIWDTDGNVVYDNGVKYDDGQLIEAPEGDRVLVGGIKIRR